MPGGKYKTQVPGHGVTSYKTKEDLDKFLIKSEWNILWLPWTGTKK